MLSFFSSLLYVLFIYFLKSLKLLLNTVLLRSGEGREWCPYITGLALRRVSWHHYIFWSRRQPTGLSLSCSLFFFSCCFKAFHTISAGRGRATLRHRNYTSGREDSNTTVHIYYWWYIYTLLVISDKTPPKHAIQCLSVLIATFYASAIQPSLSSIWSKVQ